MRQRLSDFYGTLEGKYTTLTQRLDVTLCTLLQLGNNEGPGLQREREGQGWDQFQVRKTGPAEKGRELFPESVSQTDASESTPTPQHTGGS